MSAESDAQMQQFTEAVYSQNDSESELVAQSPLAAIEARSVRFTQWRDTMLGESEPVPEIPERLLRHWVDGDIASFKLLSSDDEEIAADNISANFQNYEAYRLEMQQLAGDVADKVEVLKKESLRRGIEQDRVTAKDLVARLRDTDAQAKLPKDTSGLNGFSGGEQHPDHAPELPTASKVLESITYKTRPDGSVLYLVSERPAFIDHGRHIIVEDKALDDEESILGAVLLAKEKYGGAFSLTGTDDFKRKALEVMLKNNVEVRLKSPAQEMLLRELAVAYPNYKLPPAMPKHTQGATGETVQDDALTSVDAQVAVTVNPPTLKLVEPIARPVTASSEVTPISAKDWWQVQHAIIESWSADDKDREVQLVALGPQPTAEIVYWFDKSGHQVATPSNAQELLAAFEQSRTATNSYPAQQESQMTEQEASPGVNQENGNDQKLILRGVIKVDDKFETTVLLFKGKGDYLQGFMEVDGVKHQVIAHLNERKPDETTGEIKPNFLKLSKAVGQGDDIKWEEFGFGNALNKRNDSKPVYFDDVLFNIGGKTLSARVTKHVDDDMHRKLGFVQDRVARPERAKAGEQPAEAAPDPKAKAQAAQPEAQQPQAAASAQKTTGQKKTRSSARA